jgi:hypothetical protein
MEKQVEMHEIYEFDKYCHLWNIFGGGSGKGLDLLRKIVDSIHANNYSNPGNKLPSILITGQGKDLIAKATVNSLNIDDVRVCKARYFENGILSYQFFNDSLTNTAHIIEDVEQLKETYESVLWRYLEQRCCQYFKFGNRSCDVILHCNGIIILTAKDIKSVSKNIVNSVDHIIELEPYTREQFLLIAHQYLKFCGIGYDGESVLQEIVGSVPQGIRVVIKNLKICIVMVRANLETCLTVEIVKKAKRIVVPAADDDIQF